MSCGHRTGHSRTRDLAQGICGAEGRGVLDKRLLNKVAKRTSKALRMMRAAKLVAVSQYERSTCFWVVA